MLIAKIRREQQKIKPNTTTKAASTLEQDLMLADEQLYKQVSSYCSLWGRISRYPQGDIPPQHNKHSLAYRSGHHWFVLADQMIPLLPQ